MTRSVSVEFEKSSKFKNIIFSSSIDFIHEFFLFEKNYLKIFPIQYSTSSKSKSFYIIYHKKFLTKVLIKFVLYSCVAKII